MFKIIYLLSFVLAFSANAQNIGSVYLTHFCFKELNEVCKNRTDGYTCLKTTTSKKSQYCETALAAYTKEFNGFFGPCLSEKLNTCKTLEPGKGLIQPCLEKIKSKVSIACAKHIDKPYKTKFTDLSFDIQYHCRSEITKFCSKLKYGENRLTNCLKENKKSLSSNCANFAQIFF